MIAVECLYTGSYEPGKKSIQQQQLESRILVAMLGWTIHKELVETDRDKQLPMAYRKAIQEIISDAKAGSFHVFLTWGVRNLSDSVDERLGFLQTMEREGITMLLLDMDRMALMMGGLLLGIHDAVPIETPKHFFKKYEIGDIIRWWDEDLRALIKAVSTPKEQEVE